MTDKPGLLTLEQRRNIAVVLPITVAGLLLFVFNYYFGGVIERALLFILDLVENQTAFCIAIGVALALFAGVVYAVTDKFETDLGSIRAVKFVRILIQVSPAAIGALGLLIVGLSLLSLVLTYGRLGPYRIALITDAVPSTVQPALVDVRERIRSEWGDGVELSPITVSATSSDLLAELSAASREPYDIIIIDHSKLGRVIDEGRLRTVLSPYTIYIAMTPLSRAQLHSHRFIVSAYPDPFTQIYDLNSLMRRRNQTLAQLVVSDTSYGRAFAQIAPRIIDAASNGRRRLVVVSESEVADAPPCPAARRSSCPAMVAVLDPYVEPTVVSFLARHAARPVVIDHRLNQMLLARGESIEMLAMPAPDAGSVITAFAVAHATNGRPISVRRSLFSGGDQLMEAAFVRIRDDGALIYLTTDGED